MKSLCGLIAKRFIAIAVVLCCLIFAGCDYEVPITSTPTRKVDQRLLGDWVSKDGKEHIKVRELDAYTYVVDYDGSLLKAYHSDLKNIPFVSVQSLDLKDRRFAYVTWKLSSDGKHLGLRAVQGEVISNKIKSSRVIRGLLEKNLENPKLLGEEGDFVKE